MPCWLLPASSFVTLGSPSAPHGANLSCCPATVTTVSVSWNTCCGPLEPSAQSGVALQPGMGSALVHRRNDFSDEG